MALKNKIMTEKASPSFYNQVKQHLIRKWYKKTGRIPEIPWMAQKEQDILVEILGNLKPKRCLEWGSGYSTVTFPDLLPTEAEWISVEHDQAWHHIMKGKKLPLQVNLNFVTADNPEFKQREDGTYQDFKTYINFPKGYFDFILIDGRARNACVKKALQLISEQGIVILHDANRLKYQENLHLFPYQVIFEDHRKHSGGMWLASKKPVIEVHLETKKHRKLWNMHLQLLWLIRPFYNLKKKHR